MMKRFLSGTLFLAAMLCVMAVSGKADAASFAYDFSDFSVNGQSYEGVTLDNMTLTSESGDLMYTANYGGGLIAGYGASADMYMNFAAPIDFISVTAGDGAGDNDAFSLYLYEYGTNDFLGRYDSPLFGGVNQAQWYTLSISVANIGYVLFDPANAGVLPGDINKYGGVVITDLAYNTVDGAPVPEPATMILLASGLVGLVGSRRKTLKK